MNYAGKWLLLALACSPAVAAGNPFIGKWKENIDNAINVVDLGHSFAERC
jgi:hypothetical protein